MVLLTYTSGPTAHAIPLTHTTKMFDRFNIVLVHKNVYIIINWDEVSKKSEMERKLLFLSLCVTSNMVSSILTKIYENF